jgi:ribonuclease-3
VTLISSGDLVGARGDGQGEKMRFFSRGPLSSFERRIGYRFRRRELLERALTHRSYVNEKGLDRNYERLEFLGDAVLGLVTGEWLFGEHPEVAEGELSALKGRLVSEKALAEYARLVGLGEHIRLGVGEERSGGRNKRSLLADSMEAVIGAAFLDGGLRGARNVVLPMLGLLSGDSVGGDLRDPKTRLQEKAQAEGWALPAYRGLAEQGPDHAKTFVVECTVGEQFAARGEGRSKKAAEQIAAAAVLDVLEADAPQG